MTDKVSPVRCKIILTLAECNMNASETGKRIFMSPSAVKWNLDRIKEITGKDPRNFYDLMELVKMVKDLVGE